MYKSFSAEFTISHYFNELCNLIKVMQHLIKLSEHYNLKKNGWSNFVSKFYFNSWVQNKRFKYYVLFISINPVHLKNVQLKIDLKCQFSKVNIN